jgi:hypothetical protein
LIFDPGLRRKDESVNLKEKLDVSNQVTLVNGVKESKKCVLMEEDSLIRLLYDDSLVSIVEYEVDFSRNLESMENPNNLTLFKDFPSSHYSP